MLSLFGFVKHEGELLTLNKPSILLLYLAHQADWVSRDELAFLLKPDEPEKAAKNYIRVLLHRTKAVDFAKHLEIDQDKLRLTVTTDTQSFKKALSDDKLEQALELYQGEFLHGFNAQSALEFEDWIYAEREQYAQQFLTALRRYLEQEQFNTEKATLFLERAFEIEPFKEYWQLEYYKQLAKSGQILKIQAAFESFKNLLKDDLDSEPNKDFCEEVKALLEQPEKPASRLQIESTNFKKVVLPRAKTGFIGREQELALLQDQILGQGVPLITLVGLGGSGKTRLALELGHKLKSEFEQAYFVDLSEAVSEEDVKTSLMATTNVQLLAKPEPWLAFKEILTLKTLLILDNCEQLDDITALLTELIQDCPDLTLAVTSRKALKLSSEYLFDVSGLALPPADLTDLGSLNHYSAAVLFIERVQQLQQFYRWTEEALKSVITICRLTEGMPLALELAAGWVRLLSIPEIEAELSSNLDLLEAQQHDVHERHQSVKTVFESSFAQLSEKEQTVLLALSVFQGGWTLSAAKTVTLAHLPLLLNLSNKALVRRESNTRFGLHMLLRQFLLERAKSSADYETWLQRHAAYYLEAIRQLQGEQLVDGLNSDFDNFRAAWFYKLDHNNKELHSVLKKFIIFIETTGRSSEGLSFIKQSTKVLEELNWREDCLLANLYSELAYLYIEQGDRDGAERYISSALAALPQNPTFLTEQADCKMRLSFIYYRTGQTQKRLDIAHDALKDLNAIDSKEKAICLRHLGGAYHAANELERSRYYYEESIRLLRKHHSDIDDGKRQLGISLMNYGYLLQGHMQNENIEGLDKVLGIYKEANQLFLATGFLKGAGFGANNIASVLLLLGRVKEAEPYYHKALELGKKLGIVHLEIYVYIGLAKIILLEDGLKDTQRRQEAFKIMAKARGLALTHNPQDLPHVLMLYAELYKCMAKRFRVIQIYSALYVEQDLTPATRAAILRVKNELGFEFLEEPLPSPTDLALSLGNEVIFSSKVV